MGTSVKQEGKYQSMYAPSPSYPSRMAGNVVTVPSELTNEIDPRQRYRVMGEQPQTTYTEATPAEEQRTAEQQAPQMQQPNPNLSPADQWAQQMALSRLDYLQRAKEGRG